MTLLNDLLVQSRKASTKQPVSLSPAWERVRVRGQFTLTPYQARGRLQALASPLKGEEYHER